MHVQTRSKITAIRDILSSFRATKEYKRSSCDQQTDQCSASLKGLWLWTSSRFYRIIQRRRFQPFMIQTLRQRKLSRTWDVCISWHSCNMSFSMCWKHPEMKIKIWSVIWENWLPADWLESSRREALGWKVPDSRPAVNVWLWKMNE